MHEQLQQRPRRVVVCGRDEQIAHRVSAVLSDVEIEQVPDNRALMGAVEAQPAEIIVTSRESTGKENVDVMRDIQRLSAPRIAKVIILARDSTREDVIAAMRAHAFSYFSKPYFEAAFDEILRHAASPTEWEDSIQVNSATPAWLRVIGRCELAT